MSPVLSVPVFGGGVVLEGSSDAQRTDELQACDSYMIGARGQLVVASDLTDFPVSVSDHIGNLTQIYGVEQMVGGQNATLIAIGSGPAGKYTLWTYKLLTSGTAVYTTELATALLTDRVNVTFATLPFFDPRFGGQVFPVLVCQGARSSDMAKSSSVPGVFAVRFLAAIPDMQNVNQFDGLGTGPLAADGTVGTKGKVLYFRGITAYNNHAWGWGFDSNSGDGEGPNRLNFSNLGQPLKWGLDPADANPALLGTDRDYTDSDAFTIGGLGTIIRCCVVWAGKLWVGTTSGLYYVEGFGRESFKTNGSIPVVAAALAIGPRAMVEGPDRLLHGVGDTGQWVFNGESLEHVGHRLINYDGTSPGFWDLIWTDPSIGTTGYPGKTNQDLVWMLSVPDFNEVWTVIPFCNATLGYGPGADTVIIKYNVVTGGYTRQVYAGVALTAGLIFSRDVDRRRAITIAAPGLTPNVKRYGYRPTEHATTVLPTTLPDVTFGEYAPFGPDGIGVLRKKYLTLSWANASTTLGLVFTLTPTVDGETFAAVTLTISASAPGAPADGDLWLDTSGSDTNIGNGTAGAIIPANAADFLLKRWKTSWAKWVQVPAGGQQGRRVTLPIAFNYAVGTRFTVRMQCTAADRRYQVEGFSDLPAPVRDAI